MNKGTLARKVGLAALAAILAFAGLAPFAPGASAAANYSQIRFDGEDRFDTAALIAGAIAEATPTAVIARADIYPDALTGAYAAASNDDAPILLTRSDSLPQRTADALEDENVDNVILLGGPDAIEPGVETTLEGLGYNVDRIFGETRYQTAIEIAEQGAAPGNNSDGEASALISSGENFPDALSGAPLSFAAFFPSLLVPKTTENANPAVETALVGFVDQVTDALNGLGIDQVYILGGPAAVDEGVETMIVDAGFDVERLAGANRGATSVKVFEFGLDEGIYTNTRFGIARGDTFPDALGYAPLGGRPRPVVAPASGAADTGGLSNGLLLANGTCALHDEVATFLAAHSDTWTRGEILGGDEAICPELADLIQDLATSGLSDVTLDNTEGAPGATVTGNVSGENIDSVTVSGCGLSNEDVTLDANGDFSFDLPATQTTDCTLVFTTTFEDGTTETDTFQFDVQAPGESNVTLTPASGPTGSNVTAALSGDRPGDVTDVSSTNCTITNEADQGTSRTFTIAGADGTACQVVSTVTFSDAQGGTQNFTDTFTISSGTTPPPTGGTQGVGAGPQLATDGPDLLSATIVQTAPTGSTTEFHVVRYTFDDQVVLGGTPCPGGVDAAGTASDGEFSVGGFDSDSFLACNAARIDTADTTGRSVLVEFSAAGTKAIGEYTIATVESNAVTDNETPANPNVLASKPLGGGGSAVTTGRTAGPDLVSVTRNATTGDLTYTFDQNIEPGSDTDWAFHWYDQFGTRYVCMFTNNGSDVAVTPCTTATQGANQVLVDVAGPEVTQNAVRYSVAPDSADSVGGVLPATLGHTGSATQAADLLSVTPAATPGVYLFKFDRNLSQAGVNNGCQSFVLYLSNREESRGDTGCFIVNGSPDTVQVSFSSEDCNCGWTINGSDDTLINQDNATDVVLAAAGNDAVETTAPAQGSTIGAVPITGFSGNRAGITDGPDLILATFNTAASQVTFRFDEAIDFADVDPGSFFVVNRDGVATAGVSATASANAAEVIITFPTAQSVVEGVGAGVVNTLPISDQTGVTNDDDAVEDPQNNQNSPDSVGRS